MTPRIRQRGAAVLMAIGVSALAATAATAMLALQTVWAREHVLRADHAQARVLTGAAIDWSRAVLAQDRRAGGPDHLLEPWALEVGPVSVENGTASGALVDQQGLFNLNNLVNGGGASARHVERFERLLTTLGLPRSLADALVDWLDADALPRSADGAEDAYYARLEPPYAAANRTLADLSELGLVRGFDAAVRARLHGYVTALPGRTAVNVNTAPAEVLVAAMPGMSVREAHAVVARRAREPYTGLPELLGAIAAPVDATLDDVGFSSDYFTVTVEVQVGDAQARATALLARRGTPWPAVMWRKLE